MEEKAVKRVMKGNCEGSYIFETDEMTKQVEVIPPGIYKIQDIGNMFTGIKLMYTPTESKEKYVDIANGTVSAALRKTENFFKPEIKKRYADIGVAHKTGLLLYGPPGTGKTVTANIIMDKLCKKYDAIGIVIGKSEPRIWKACLSEILPMKRPIIFFADECEYTLDHYEGEWLTFLDGHESIQNFIFIGCTNYIGQISSRMKRPSRIEHLIEVNSIEEEVAKHYVEIKVPMLSGDLKAAMVHHAMDKKVTIDVFKNAVKEFYVYNEKGTPDEFQKILKSYIRIEKEEE